MTFGSCYPDHVLDCLIPRSDQKNWDRAKSEATYINDHAFSKTSPAVFHSTPLTLFSVDLSKPVIAHFIHEAVQEYGWTLPIHTELSLWCEVVSLFDMLPFFCATTDANHPQKFIYV